MGGRAPLQRLAAAGIIADRAVVFARHRGLGLLLTNGLAHIADLEGFASGVGRVVLASEREPMAHSQYVETLHNLIGAEATSRLLAREVGDFPGRLGRHNRLSRRRVQPLEHLCPWQRHRPDGALRGLVGLRPPIGPA